MEEFIMTDSRFFYCEHCGKVIELIGGCQGCPTICCGEPMKELVANVTDGATEKHVPDVTIDGNTVKVQVGSVMHPMTEAHSIMFVELITDKAHHRVDFKPGDAPVATFDIEGEKPLKVYEFCNLHGLWVKEL